MVFAYVVIYTEALPVIRFQLSKGSMKYESFRVTVLDGGEGGTPEVACGPRGGQPRLEAVGAFRAFLSLSGFGNMAVLLSVHLEGLPCAPLAPLNFNSRLSFLL